MCCRGLAAHNGQLLDDIKSFARRFVLKNVDQNI